MKATSKKILAGALATALGASALALGGCEAADYMAVSVDNANKRAVVASALAIDAEGFEQALKTVLEADGDFDQASYDEMVAKLRAGELGEYTYDGECYTFTSKSEGYDSAYKDTFAIYGNTIRDMLSSQLDAETMEMLEALEDDYEFMECTVTFDIDTNGQKVVHTNMEQDADGNYVTDIELSGAAIERIMTGWSANYICVEPAYVCFSSEYKDTKSVTIPKYSNGVVAVSTPGIIKNMSIDGSKTYAVDSVILDKEGTYTIGVTLENGYSTSGKTLVDFTAPTAKIGSTTVKNGKTIKVKKNSKLTAKDALSRVKSIKFGGKTIKNGAKITKNGTLVVTDKAGNTLKATVKVK